jgi:hypothetical protein
MEQNSDDLRRRKLEAENRSLRRKLADLTCEVAMLQEFVMRGAEPATPPQAVSRGTPPRSGSRW